MYLARTNLNGCLDVSRLPDVCLQLLYGEETFYTGTHDEGGKRKCCGVKALTNVEAVKSKKMGNIRLHAQAFPYVCRAEMYISPLSVKGIDAVDNGVKQYDTNLPRKYASDTRLSARVPGVLNLYWMDWMDGHTTKKGR